MLTLSTLRPVPYRVSSVVTLELDRIQPRLFSLIKLRTLTFIERNASDYGGFDQDIVLTTHPHTRGVVRVVVNSHHLFWMYQGG